MSTSMRGSIDAARSGQPRMDADGTAIFEFRFSPDDPAFAGHFPGHPLVPGAFQLEMARAAAEWRLGCALEVREVCKAKFLRPIGPGETVSLELKWTETNGMIHAQTRLFAGGQPAGEATLKLWRSAPK